MPTVRAVNKSSTAEARLQKRVTDLKAALVAAQHQASAHQTPSDRRESKPLEETVIGQPSARNLLVGAVHSLKHPKLQDHALDSDVVDVGKDSLPRPSASPNGRTSSGWDALRSKTIRNSVSAPAMDFAEAAAAAVQQARAAATAGESDTKQITKVRTVRPRSLSNGSNVDRKGVKLRRGNLLRVGSFHRGSKSSVTAEEEKWDLVFVFNKDHKSHTTPKAILKSVLHPNKVPGDDASQRDNSGSARSNVTVAFETFFNDLKDHFLWDQEDAVLPIECFFAAFHPLHFDCAPIRFDADDESHGLDHDYLAFGVRWKRDAMHEFAQDIGFLMQLSPEMLRRKLGIRYNEEDGEWNPPAFIPYRKDMHELFLLVDPESGITELHGSHSRKELEERTCSAPSNEPLPPWKKGNVLDSKNRQRLLWMYCFGQFNLVSCLREGFLAGVLAPHQQHRLRSIRKSIRWWKLLDPRFYFFHQTHRPIKLHVINDYFGEHVAFYFAFGQFICVIFFWYMVCALLAAAAGTTVHSSRYLGPGGAWPGLREEDWQRLMFLLPSALFGAFYTQLWRRVENAMLCNWGLNVLSMDDEKLWCSLDDCVLTTAEFDHSEECKVLSPDLRVQFRGHVLAVAVEICYLVVTFVVFVHGGIYLQTTHSFSPRVAIYCYSLLTIITKKLWDAFIGPILTDWEVHKFQHEWDYACDRRRNIVAAISGTFPFLLHIVGPLRPKTGPRDCMILLVHQLRVSMLVNLAFVVLDILFPCVEFYLRRSCLSKEARKAPMSRLAKQFLEPEYNGDEVSSDFTELIQPLIIMNLFGWVDPIVSPALLFCQIIVNLMVDSDKILRFFRRPSATKAKGLGDFRWTYLTVSARIGIWIKVYLLFFDTPWVENIELGAFSAFPGFSSLRVPGAAGAVLFVLLNLERLVVSLIPEKQGRTKIIEQRHQWQQQRLARMELDDEDFTPDSVTIDDVRAVLGIEFADAASDSSGSDGGV